MLSFCGRGGSARGASFDPRLITKVTRGDLHISVTEIGHIEPCEKIAIKSKVAGQVEKVLVDEGMNVKAGQLLLQIAPEEFQRNLERTRQEVQKTQAAVDQAKLTLSRRVNALGYRAISQAEVDDARSEYRQRRIALKQTREAVRASEDQLRYARIVSPISGTIIQRTIRVGETVVPGTMATMDDRALMMVADLSTLIAKVDLNQIDVAKVRIGQSVSVMLDALPGKTYKAKVTKIAPASVLALSKEVQVFPVEATLEGTGLDAIRPGMTADVEIHIETKKNVLMLPIEAVTKERSLAYVYRVLRDETGQRLPRLKRVYVELGLRNDREQEIVSGLSEGDEVQIRPPTAEANEYQ
jgi:RND family efflux transporter MFP subunit